MKYQDVIEKIKEYIVEYEEKDLNFNYLSHSSKDIKENTLFICKGITFKKEYLEEAINNGSTCYISEIKYDAKIPGIIVNNIRRVMAILSNEFFSDNLYKVGVTGTKGKTTTISFIHNILNNYQKTKTGYISTIDLYTGKRCEESHNTTPESLDLHKYLHEMEISNIKYMCMEVSSQAVKHDRIFGIEYEIGAFLNIGEDHISPLEHKDFEDYFLSKVSFLKQCKKIFVYKNIDEFKRIKDILNKDIITFGYTKDCDYYVKDIKEDKSFTVVHNNEEEIYKINMLGLFNITNALCAIAISKELGIDYEDIKKGLLETKVLGRMNIYYGKCPIIVDYAHNYLSAYNLYESVKKEFKEKNIKVVFGCPGDRGINRRKEMGELANEYAEYVYLTSEDPQTKDPYSINKEIIPYLTNTEYEEIIDREEAIIKAINDSKEDDIILIIGKGNEEYQLINNEYIPYKSDIKVVEDFLSKVKE